MTAQRHLAEDTSAEITQRDGYGQEYGLVPVFRLSLENSPGEYLEALSHGFVYRHVSWLAVWLSGNALASINVVALRQTRLVSGWVTVGM